MAKQLSIVVQRLNPQADVHIWSEGGVPITALLNTNRFSMEATESDERWFAEVHAGSAEGRRFIPVHEPLMAIPPSENSKPATSTNRQRERPRASRSLQLSAAFGRNNACDCGEC